MPRLRKSAAREQGARATILEVGRAPEEILDAILNATSLDMNELGTLVLRSGYTIRRWRGMDEAEIPAAAANALEDLRSIIAMLIEADYSKRAITSFLRSRNAGLGRDRPLDGLRSDIGEFARVEHITQCFIEGIPPEQGRYVIERPRATLPVTLEDPLPNGGPSEPVDASGPEAKSASEDRVRV